MDWLRNEFPIFALSGVRTALPKGSERSQSAYLMMQASFAIATLSFDYGHREVQERSALRSGRSIKLPSALWGFLWIKRTLHPTPVEWSAPQ